MDLNGSVDWSERHDVVGAESSREMYAEVEAMEGRTTGGEGGGVVDQVGSFPFPSLPWGAEGLASGGWLVRGGGGGSGGVGETAEKTLE